MTSKNNITQHYTGYENNDTHRVYAKIAFNVLAFLKGEEFVQQNEFDDFRRWIITGDFEEKHLVKFGDKNNPICEQMPNFSHYCIFYLFLCFCSQLNYTIESTNRATLSGYPVFIFEMLMQQPLKC